MNPFLIIGAIAVGAYVFLKKVPLPGRSGVVGAATTSPIGSSSGVLVPVPSTSLAAQHGLLQGIEAFIGAGTQAFAPGQTTSQINETLSQSAINSSVSSAPIYTDPLISPAVTAAPDLLTETSPDLSYLGDTYSAPDLSAPVDTSMIADNSCVDC